MDYRAPTPEGLKPKDLIGVPWRIAFALQSDGWYLRSDIIWYKPNCQPESVKDRPTRAEYLFLFSKSEDYFYNQKAILEPATSRKGTRNRQTVWSINTEPIADAHFATFPPSLIEPAILAGTEPDDMVLDPFFGSGTVGGVCLRLNRRFVGIELKPEYAEIAARRLRWQKAEGNASGTGTSGVSRPEARRTNRLLRTTTLPIRPHRRRLVSGRCSVPSRV
jgi:DNA modification methylase